MSDKLDELFTVRITSKMKFELGEMTEAQHLLLTSKVRETIAKVIHACRFNIKDFGLKSNDTDFFE